MALRAPGSHQAVPPHLCHEDALHGRVVLEVLVHVQHQDGSALRVRKVDPAGAREGLKPLQKSPPKLGVTPKPQPRVPGTGWDSLRGPVHQPVLVLGVELLQVSQLDPALLAPRPPPQPLQARLGG